MVYIIGIFYFKNHFYFRTYINNINISACDLSSGHEKIERKTKDYKINIIGRNNINSVIEGNDINLQYNDKKVINNILTNQNSFLWIFNNFKKNYFIDKNLFSYNNELFNDKALNFKILREDVKEPKDAYLKYSNMSYEIIKEENGNKINEEKYLDCLKESIEDGEVTIDLDSKKCYEKPKYTSNSMEIVQAKEMAEKYISSKIVYDFENDSEVLDGNKINEFIKIDENYNVSLDEKKISEYIDMLSEKYDTYEGEREFITSSNKKIIVKGGNYGFRINKNKEKLQLINDIKKGQTIEREVMYIQKALLPGKNDIGNTYVEVNITAQHLWFYKDGILVTQGDIVSGNESRGWNTPSGVYSLNYKAKDVVLKGDNYSSKVKYWMPFNGNIGLHDAYWRGSFGGNIYKNNGTHGCVNMPYYLAKKIYENIEEKIPVICYRE